MKIRYSFLLISISLTTNITMAVEPPIHSNNNTLTFTEDKNGNTFTASYLSNNKLTNSFNNRVLASESTIINSSDNDIGKRDEIIHIGYNLWEIDSFYIELINSNKNKIYGAYNKLEKSNLNSMETNFSELKNSNKNSILGVKNTLDNSDQNTVHGDNNKLQNSNDNNLNYVQGVILINSDKNEISAHWNNLTNSQENTITNAHNTLISSNKNKISGANNTLKHTIGSDINGNDNYIIHGNNLFKDDQNQLITQITPSNSVLGGNGNAGIGSSMAEINSSVVLGHNTTATTTATYLKNAVALNAEGAAGDTVIAIGGKADGDNTVAIGVGSSSTNGGIALGVGSIATRADELNIGHRQITGVKAGIEDNHIVNVKQLNGSLDNVLKQAKTHIEVGTAALSKEIKTKTDTLQAQANKHTDDILLPMKDDAKQRFQHITRQSTHYTDIQTTKYQALSDKMSKNYTGSRFDQLSRSVDKQQKKINAGISAAMATAAIPQKGGNKFSVGIGIASYRDQAAGAVGSIFTISPHAQIKVAMTYDTQSGTGLNSGIAIGF
ncbi:hypothetical protein Xvie_02789 [Xenorhabdus vietnamensis]|uniref:Trimeric autotransporter adhesin YadA-like C-terminal membrane anchor domain-containing protein n=1 Tax=Xenorhabdus vietnamensis TaxID=351656 RepID=A0A1Y2SDB0_9GAMM|nr:YadA C-terminal domain-containing protein [Xenorhabdus vietnamensis]OTA15504.1 hypothetical protein Xvie_02789 [Xenorhabdus vietnamensis]